MPVYLALTLVLFLKELKKDLKGLGLLILGFMIPILIFLPWLRAHPDTLLNQVSYIGGLDKTVEVERGLLGVFNIKRLGGFASNYLTYFSPKILFVTGDRSMVHSTGKVGAFLFPVVFLLVFGALDILRSKDKFAKLLLFGFLTYPIAPALVNDPERISRGFVVIPFAILLSIYGIRFLFSQKDRIFHYLVVLAIGFSVFQFLGFLVDYHGPYRERSYPWFNNDIGGALESALKSTQIREVDNVYLDEYIPFVDLYFEFYQRKLGIDAREKWAFYPPSQKGLSLRRDFAPDEASGKDTTRAIEWELYDFREGEFSRFSAGSLVVVRRDHIGAPLDNTGAFEKIETIRELDGSETFYVYYRDK